MRTTKPSMSQFPVEKQEQQSVGMMKFTVELTTLCFFLFQDLLNKIEPTIFEWTSDLKGSISAEHGLGFKKRNFMHYSKSSGAIELMKKMKAIMDPNGILNPYKVLPDK